MIHNIRYRIFVYENEDEDEVLDALRNILPSATVERELAEGMLDDEIVILSGIIDKKRYLKEFARGLLQLDKDQLDKLISDLDKKIDDKGNLFLRFSKSDALDEIWTIVDSGDSIHLKVKIAAYPAKKENALKNITEFLTNGNN